MAAVTQNITAEQGSALSVTFTGAANGSLQGRSLRMHVREKYASTATKLTASTAAGTMTVGTDPYTSATLALDSAVMGAVSVSNATEYWVYDVESYTSSTDVRREWQGTFTITRDVTRDTEATEEDRLAGVVRYDTTQSLTSAQQLQARTNIGAGTGGGGGTWGSITGTLSSQTDLQSALDAKQAASATLTTLSSATAAGLALMDDATAADQRTTLGLGTAATQASSAFDAAGTASAAVSAHEAALDPHPAYTTAAEAAAAAPVQSVAGRTGAVTLSTSDVSGLGGAALLNVGTGAGTVAAGDDSRLSNARTPTAHASSHATAGSDPITPADIGAAAASHSHAASDITSGTLDAARLPAASTTAAGAVELATVAEAEAGTDTARAVTPEGVAAAIAALGGGGGSPGGSSGQVQFNNAGAFGGMSGTSWDDTNRILGFNTIADGPVLNINTSSAGRTYATLWVNHGAIASTANGWVLGLGSGTIPDTASIYGGQNSTVTIDPIQGNSKVVFTMAGVHFYAGYAGPFVFQPEGANVGGFRNGTNAQTFRVYRSFTDASNYSRWSVQWNTSTAILHAEGAGTGTDGSVAFNDAALATNATRGFLMIPSCAGTPTGTPADIPTGQAPIVWDSTNKKLCVWDGAAWVQTPALT